MPEHPTVPRFFFCPRWTDTVVSQPCTNIIRCQGCHGRCIEPQNRLHGGAFSDFPTQFSFLVSMGRRPSNFAVLIYLDVQCGSTSPSCLRTHKTRKQRNICAVSAVIVLGCIACGESNESPAECERWCQWRLNRTLGLYSARDGKGCHR